MIEKIGKGPLSVRYTIEDESIIPGMKNLRTDILWNGVKAPNMVIRNHLSKRYTALNLMGEDLKFCSLYLDEMEKIKEGNVISKACSTAFGVSYARCFNSGKRSRLNERKIFKGRKDLSDIHNEIIDMRNEYLAHGGDSYYENCNTVAVFNPSLESLDDMVVMNFGRHSAGLTPNKVAQYRQVVKFLISHVDQEMKSLNAKMVKEIKNFGIKEVVAVVGQQIE